MRLQVLLGDLGLGRSVEKRVEQHEFLFFVAAGHNRDEVDELGVVDRAIQLGTVLDHEEDFIGQVGVLDVEQFEVLEQFSFSNDLVLGQPIKLFLNLR